MHIVTSISLVKDAKSINDSNKLLSNRKRLLFVLLNGKGESKRQTLKRRLKNNQFNYMM